ncbi:hypothetical protein WJ85_15180 [Burkholderia ubonensis]|uniref:hypothetical protein n=1 Tax=Burkholderia ubonensis TaxID=101571 RepID=UPI000756A739|nr:hypothetical protein [Burkholderia ubonensis]KVP13597.1 hypothetical protein WJ85_15180 [Burkholderia ubonensis]KWC00053.1 hypothetical protein WL44_01240 [Burkholderia ubonensis]
MNAIAAYAIVRRPAQDGHGVSRARETTQPVEIPAFARARPLPNGEYDGLLKEGVRDTDLTVTVPFPGDVLDAPKPFPDKVLLLFGPNDDEAVEVGRVDITAANFGRPLPMTLLAADRTEGTHRIGYSIVSGLLEDEIARGVMSTIIVDLTAPGRPHLGRPDFDRDIEDNGLTAEKLADMGDELPCSVAGYEGMAEGDWIFGLVDGGWWGGTQTFSEVGMGEVGQPIEFVYPADVLREVDDGRTEFNYFVEDRAGNRSLISETTYIDLLLKGAIPDLASPAVPLFDQNCLITDAIARVPVAVRIPGNDRIIEGDDVEVHWGGAKVPRVRVEATDVGQDPLFEVEVKYRTVEEQWPGPGTSPVQVTYEVFRGPQSLGSAKVPVTVQVNLNLPGGPDPNPDEPEHGHLDKPEVKSFGGSSNVIPPEESDQDAKVTIPLDNNDNPPVKVFEMGDDLEVTWNTSIVTVPGWRPLTQAEVDGTQAIEVTVPGATVATTAGEIPVFYRVRRAVGVDCSGAPAYGISPSPRQFVLVKNRFEFPGGGEPLPLAEFTRRNANNAIGRKDVEANDGTPLQVPFYFNKSFYDKIVISIRLFDDLSNGNPVGDPYSDERDVVEDVFTFWDFHVPADFLFTDPDLYGRAEATYKVVNERTGPDGVDAGVTTVYLDMRHQP